MPMLDEHEFEQVDAIYRQCIEAIQRDRAEHELPLQSIDLAAACAPVLAVYNELTGFAETNPNAILHHRTAFYGPRAAPAVDRCDRQRHRSVQLAARSQRTRNERSAANWPANSS